MGKAEGALASCLEGCDSAHFAPLASRRKTRIDAFVTQPSLHLLGRPGAPRRESRQAQAPSGWHARRTILAPGEGWLEGREGHRSAGGDHPPSTRGPAPRQPAIRELLGQELDAAAASSPRSLGQLPWPKFSHPRCSVRSAPSRGTRRSRCPHVFPGKGLSPVPAAFDQPHVIWE